MQVVLSAGPGATLMSNMEPGRGPKPMVHNGSILVGRCTTHFGADFSGDWDVDWGYDLDFDPWPPLRRPPFSFEMDPPGGFHVCGTEGNETLSIRKR